MTIDVSGLVKQYGSHFTLSIPSLHIEAGDAYGLVGNNGAGKTTFLRLLLDLIRATSGQISIDGRSVAASTAWKQRTGSYLDESFLLDYLTPLEYFQFTGSLYGLSRRQVEHALDPYRAFLSSILDDRGTRYIRDLSKGNAKKVGIVAAMLVTPALLVLDEPFANLDPGSQIQLKLLLSQINLAHGTTLLLSSHDLIHVTDLCSRVGIIEEGNLVRDLATSEATLADLELYFASRMA